jgi:hypothetical protein
MSTTWILDHLVGVPFESVVRTIVLKKSSADRQYVITLRRGVELEDGLS